MVRASPPSLYATLRMRLLVEWERNPLKVVSAAAGMLLLVPSLLYIGLTSISGLPAGSLSFPSSSSSLASASGSVATAAAALSAAAAAPAIPLSHAIPDIFSAGEDRSSAINTPHASDTLVELFVSSERRDELERAVAEGGIKHSWTLTHRQACDIELLINGGFTPLTGFMDEATYTTVVEEMRLGDTAAHPQYKNALFPMPITLDIPSSLAQQLKKGDRLALRDEYYNFIAVLTVEDLYKPDKQKEAQMVFGTTDDSHPAVDFLFHTANEWYVGGKVEGLQLPHHYDYPSQRLTPAQVRAAIAEKGWKRTVAFQTRNPMHRAHIELTRLAAAEQKAGVLIHPVVGMTKPGDIEASVRVRCYQAMIRSGRYYHPDGVMLALLPLAMRMAGPREALWHAIIRKNHGATHFIVGRDHAGCKSAGGKDFYGPYDAQQLVQKHEAELGMHILTYQEVEYVPSLDVYLPGNKLPAGEKTASISGTKFRAMMNKGEPIPSWFSDPDVINILSQFIPPLHKRGFVLFFTGLSGGGKTTIAHALLQRMNSLMPTRRVTLLDGDVVRTHLSKGLGFSIQDRNANVARIGWVGGESVRHGGIVLASSISPFEESRRAARELATAAGGGFIQIYVSSSLETCSRRDVKGLYEQASHGKVELTGITHPYELPSTGTELHIDAGSTSIHQSVTAIVATLVKQGYIHAAEGELSEEERYLAGVISAVGEGVAKAQKERKEKAAAAAGADSVQATNVHLSLPALPEQGISSSISALLAQPERLVQLFSEGQQDVSRHICRPDWDAYIAPRYSSNAGKADKKEKKEIRLYGGQPMINSPSSKQVTIAKDGDGAFLDKPSELILALAQGPLAFALRASVAASIAGGAGGKGASLRSGGKSDAAGATGSASSALPLYGLPSSRILFTEHITKSKGGAMPAENVEQPLLVPAATADVQGYSSSSYSTAAAAAVAVSARAASDVDPLLQAGGTLATSKLQESERLLVSYDLWSAMRWSSGSSAGAPAAPSSGAGAGNPTAAVYSSPRLLPYVKHMLRLDPCLHAVFMLPSDAAAASALQAAVLKEVKAARQRVEQELGMDVVSAVAGGSAAEAVDAEAVAAYLQEWEKEAVALEAEFPERILLQRADAAAVQWAVTAAGSSSGNSKAVPAAPAAVTAAAAVIREWLAGHPIQLPLL